MANRPFFPVRSVRLVLAGFVAWSVLACSGSSPSEPAPPNGGGTEYPRGVVLSNVPFCTGGGTSLRLDLSLPEGATDERVPIALFFHGGAWRSGSRTTSEWYARLDGPLLESGIAVATASYRLAPENPWPAQIEDAKCAVRFLRANADEYGLDADRFGVWGESSGAHLASLVGTTDSDVFAGSGGHAGVSSRVSAVVALYGPADLTDPTGWPPGTNTIFEAVFGTSDRDAPLLAAASPTAYVTPDDPAFLLVHGTLDLVVPIEQSVALATELAGVGVPVEGIVVEDGDHGLTSVGDRILGFDPSIPEIAVAIVAFFQAELL